MVVCSKQYHRLASLPALDTPFRTLFCTKRSASAVFFKKASLSALYIALTDGEGWWVHGFGVEQCRNSV